MKTACCHWFARDKRKTKAGACCCPGAVELVSALGCESLHEVRADRCLDHIVFKYDCGGQIRLHDFCNSRIHVALIALCIPLLRPESNSDGFLSGGLGHERQDLQEARLLLQNRQDLVTYNLKELFFLFDLRNE